MRILIIIISVLLIFISSSVVYSSTKINIISQDKPHKYFGIKSDKIVKTRSTNVSTLQDSTLSDVNFELGVGYNLLLMFVNKYNLQNKKVENSINPSLIDILFSFGFRFHKHYDVNFKFGFDEIGEDFGGLNGGIFFESDLFFSNIFGILGVGFYHSIGTSHNTSESGGNFIFYCLGFGYRATKNINLNLMYWIPNKKVFGTDIAFTDNKFIYYDKINHGVLRIGLQYSFIF